MSTVKTYRVVAVMLVLSLAISAVMAYLQLSAFFLATFLVPGLIAAYYQRRYDLEFQKPQRKTISFWYIGILSTTGIIPLAILVNEIKDQLKEPFLPVLMALIFGVIVLTLLAYFIVYWIMGMDFRKTGQSPNKRNAHEKI